jgi:hypothetical protein
LRAALRATPVEAEPTVIQSAILKIPAAALVAMAVPVDKVVMAGTVLPLPIPLTAASEVWHSLLPLVLL